METNKQLARKIVLDLAAYVAKIQAKKDKPTAEEMKAMRRLRMLARSIKV